MSYTDDHKLVIGESAIEHMTMSQLLDLHTALASYLVVVDE